jgi:hypothetical protein
MNIETLLSNDFAALARRFANDGFAERTLRRLKGADRLRLVLVGGAGALGAALAASQFGAATEAMANAAPMLSQLTIVNSDASFSAGPVLVTTLLFAAVGGATAMIAPGSR